MPDRPTERLDLARLRPSAEVVARYRAPGYWRADTAVDDLRFWAQARPEAAAVIGHHADGTVRTMSFAALAATAERYAAALRSLGVGAGDVVSTWLPTRCELAALLVATWRVGATLSPMMPVFGPHEVSRMAARVGSRVCVTVDSAAGVDHAAALARMAPQLPELHHQLVLGRPGPGQLSLTELADAARPDDATTWSDAPVDADTPAVVMFTSGTTGDAKAVVHSLNTFSLAWLSCWNDYKFGTDTVTFTPQSLSHALGMSLFLMSLRHGGTAVMMEHWDASSALSLMDAVDVTTLVAVPTLLDEMLRASTGGTPPTQLRNVFVGGASPSSAMIEQTGQRWGLELRRCFGMTEGAFAYSRPDAPSDQGPYTIGYPAEGLEADLRADGPEPITARHPGHLRVRGPHLCLATAGRDTDEVWVTAEQNEGWYDTGDLAVLDDRCGYTLYGRAVDRVGGAFMIPVATVEDALREHPAIVDAAVIETRERGEPIPCAVVVPADATSPPSLDRVHAFLLGQGMTAIYLPRRLEIVPSLPRNAMGKVRKALLRSRFGAEHG